MPIISLLLETGQESLNAPLPPSKQHFLGTDKWNRDIFARMLYGFRISISFAILVTFFSCLIGVTIGPSWGELIKQGMKVDLSYWWIILSPVLFMFITLILVTFIGEGVRDAFDSKENVRLK